MGRGIEQVAVALEHVLRAVAVMDVEIHHRDPPQPMLPAGMLGGDRDVVEQAEAHGGIGLGMVPGRPHRAERIVRRPAEHRIDRRDHGAGRAQRRLAGAARHAGVGVEGNDAGFRDRRQHGLDEAPVVDEGECVDRRRRRFLPHQWREFRCLQRRQDGAQPVGAFGMVRPHLVRQAGRMGEQPGGHENASARSRVQDWRHRMKPWRASAAQPSMKAAPPIGVSQATGPAPVSARM